MVFDSCLWVGIDVPVLVRLFMALWCAIRTFAKHATELGNQQPAEPVFFVKPNNCLQRTGPIQVSTHPGSVHHAVSYTHLRAHETREDLVCRLLLEKKKEAGGRKE